MRLSHHHWAADSAPAPDPDAHLVLAFGPTATLSDAGALASVQRRYPGAHVVGASTGGQIQGARVSDGALVTTAVAFDGSAAEVVTAEVRDGEAGEALGRRLATQVRQRDVAGRPLVHVFALADGLAINASAVASGIEAALPEGVGVSGGLAGDDDRFERTVLWADSLLDGPSVLAVAFYGETLRVGVGAAGGWDTFGIDRRVTKSDGNVLVELDGRPALDLYEQYLGPYAAELPASGLRFPLAIRAEGTDYELVRTLLGVDREARTVRFAGDVPEGATARLMRSSTDRLIDGAHDAAGRAADMLGTSPQLGLLVSCVGRKWTMGERIEEEVEEASAALGGAPSVGFYSYGELAPAAGGGRCEFHNQTMTVTALAEV